MSNAKTNALKAAAILWVVWGLVHAFAGIMVMSSNASGGFQAVADGVAPDLLATDYHGAVGGILNQHGWNLAWFGIATVVGALFVWRQYLTAIWVTCMVGVLADFGYLLFVDLPGYVNFFPGTVMTFISGAAVILSFWVWLTERGHPEGPPGA